MATKTLREVWDEQAARYASEQWKSQYGRFLALYEEGCWYYIEPVLPAVGEGVILEAGCGSGRWVTRLAPMGYRIVLSDLSPEMVHHARVKVDRLGLSDRVLAYHTA